MLVGNEEEDPEVDSELNEEVQEKRTRAIVSNETAGILSGLGRMTKTDHSWLFITILASKIAKSWLQSWLFYNI